MKCKIDNFSVFLNIYGIVVNLSLYALGSTILLPISLQLLIS